MVQFAYKGYDGNGRSVDGVVDAADRRAAVAELTQRGHFASELIEKIKGAKAKAVEAEPKAPAEVTAAWWKVGSNRITGKDVVAVTAQISAALRAGLPILSAIDIIQAQQVKPGMRTLLGDLSKSVSTGESLSEAMGRYPNIFSKLYISMIYVGESGGILDQTIIQLSKLLVRDEKIKTNMKNAMAYPVFVLLLAIASVIVVLTWVFPKMIGTIAGTMKLLPWPTRMLMGLSDFLIGYGWLLAIVIGLAIYGFNAWKRTKAGRLKLDHILLRIPILGGVLKAIAVGRFARTLGALTKSGINILPALGVVRDTLGNEVLGQQIDHVSDRVKTGEPVATPLAESKLFPPLLVQIVSIGEQTGKIDELLTTAADTFDEEADAAITRFMAVFPAMMIAMLALVIGFIIMATLLPIMTMDLGGIGG
jgi:type IV pilus assembly protein PilC